MTDDHLQRFAMRVVEMQEKKRAFDEALMVEVAKDLGMTEGELADVKEQSRAHKQRAQSLRAAGALDDAIQELETAWAFNPLDIEISYLLADGLFTRSQRTKNDAEWARSLELARQVLEIAPAHTDAPALIVAIRNNDPAARSDNTAPITAVIVGVGVIVIAIVSLLMLVV
jgi:tetratricopeptide (TPR) repeat protein